MAIKLLLYFALIAALVFSAIWFAASPGDMVAVWRDYEITTSTANFVFAVLFLVALLAVIIPLILGLFTAPFRWWKKRQEAKYKKGLQLVTETLAAISTGDVAHAENLLKRTRKLLNQQPVIPLLQAQLAGIKKDENLLQQSFQSMLEHTETKALGSKSLAEFHMRRGDVIPAISHAEQALDLEPKNTQSLRTTLALYLKSEQFDRARDLIIQGKKRKAISAPEAKGLQALVLYLQACKASAIKDDDRARVLTLEAYRLAPHRAHLFLKAINLHNTDQHIKQAIKILKHSWQNNFTPMLATQARELMLDKAEKVRLYKKMLGLSLPGRPYLSLMLAEMSLSDQDEYTAYNWLEKYQQWSASQVVLPVKPNKHAHISVAAELAEIVKEQQQRLEQARWECQECGSVYNHWQFACDNCSSINSITAT